MPGFKSLTHITGKPVATLFEIRLESDTIVLRGTEEEASSRLLRGVVVLCLPQSLKIENVHLKVIGVSRVAWVENKTTATGVSSVKRLKTNEVLNHRWPNFVGHDGPASSSKGVTLGKTNHEWPFEFIIPGNQPETVEGLPDSEIKYFLKATVARGKFTMDLHATKRLRIVRTLDPAALELSHNMTVENIWPNKIEYSIVIPSKAVVFGTSVPVEMKFTSLLKGLKIGTVRCRLIESISLSIIEPGHTDKGNAVTRDIESWVFEVNQDHLLTEVVENVESDYYGITKNLPLPKSLKKCVQDCETQGIKVRHRLKFCIALHNPDGHTSELRATLPVTLFLSPNVPLDEDGNLLDQTPDMNLSADVGAHAPPLYGEHVMDQLFAESDQSGYATPAHASSGMNTPFYLHSRAGSIENLRNMNGDGLPHAGFRPDALSTRLQNLTSPPRSSSDPAMRNSTFSGGNTPQIPIRGGGFGHHRTTGSISTPGSLTMPNGSYFDHAHPNVTSNPQSRRPSDEERRPHRNGLASGFNSGMQTPEHLDFEDNPLSRVPSYTTAVRAPLRNMTLGEMRDLPNYQTATSRPPSPQRSQTMSSIPTLQSTTEEAHQPLAPPASAHSRTLSSDAAAQQPNPFLTASRRNHSFQHLRDLGLSALHSMRGSADEEGDRRLHLLRARGKH